MDKALLVGMTSIEKSYSLQGRSLPVLKKISLEVHQGEMVAIIGASGSGKSTLMNLIGLLDTADSGEYYLQGKNIAELSEDSRAELRNLAIGFVFQQFHLLPGFNALDNVALPLTYRNMSEKERIERAEQALEQVQMLEHARHLPGQLSGGQQQRVAIARALVTEPGLILADEPTGALDSKTGETIMDIFDRLHQQGVTLIIVTHDPKVAARCQRQICIADGEILQEAVA